MPMLNAATAAFLGRFLPSEAQRHGAQVLAHAMVEDHVHIVLRLPTRIDLPRLVQGMKGASSRLVNQDEELSKTGLRWSEGYHAASIGRRQLPIVIAYIKNQARRHPEKMVAASAVVAG
jgi:REP element-mobilizing transposase RayT